MPCGVASIRSHLEHVDNVPLLVSLFTDSTPKAALEMIKIYQENGETVLTMGSSMNSSNTQCFKQTDIAASLHPIPGKECQFKTVYETNGISFPSSSVNGGKGVGPAFTRGFSPSVDHLYRTVRELSVSASFTSLPCALPLGLCSDLNQFIPMIAEGRRLLKSFKQSLLCTAAFYLFLSLLMLLISLMNAPSPFVSYQLIWLCCVIIPCFTLSLAFSLAYEEDLMIRLPEKNYPQQTIQQYRQILFYWIARFLPSVMIYIVFYLYWLNVNVEAGMNISLWSDSNYYWSDAENILPSSALFTEIELITQNYSLVVLVFMFCVLSSGFVSSHQSIFTSNPLRNRSWIIGSLVAISAQILFCIVSLSSYNDSLTRVNTNRFLWPIFLGWPFLVLLVDEVCKKINRKTRDFHHKKERQHFDTVLGMHSPK